MLSRKTNQRRNQSNHSSAGGDEIGLLFRLIDYLTLVDWTERIIRDEQLPSGYKRGAIEDTLPPILHRLAFTEEAWNILTTTFEQQFNHWVGSGNIIKQTYSDKYYQRIPSTANHKNLLG